MSRQEEINEKLKPFFAKPISEEAKQYHREFKHHENKELPSSKEFCLINIWGLITKKENKKEILRKLTEPKTNKIITITETHLSSAQHYDVEITKYTFIITIYTEQAERHKVQARGWPLTTLRRRIYVNDQPWYSYSASFNFFKLLLQAVNHIMYTAKDNRSDSV